MLKVLRAKLHCIRVTASDFHYHGSITLDPLFCEKAAIWPLEFVEIWNKNSGARISTYVIYGERGARECVLNGAAARTCAVGDELIICASDYIADPSELAARSPRVLLFDSDNNIISSLRYVVARAGGSFSFDVVKE